MGPIRFGMSPAQVAGIIGDQVSIDDDDEGYLREYRSVELPIISYQDSHVVEVEAFREVKSVTFGDRDIFGEPGPEIMRFLEQANGGARASLGLVLFNDIGITCGRLDESPVEDHSITVFAKGLWNDRLSRLQELKLR
jgi:hypothetical protein